MRPKTSDKLSDNIDHAYLLYCRHAFKATLCGKYQPAGRKTEIDLTILLIYLVTHLNYSCKWMEFWYKKTYEK